MSRALPEIPVSELSALVRAVRTRPFHDKHLRVALGIFAAVVAILLHSAANRAWTSSQAPVGAQEENQMLSLRQIAVVSSLAVSSSALAQDAVQWRVQDGGNGHWYRLQNDGGTWQQARLTAESLGGHLATITSADENSFVWQILSISTFYPCFAMLGGFQDLTAPDYVEPAGGWRWVTGEEFGFTAWYSIEPNDGGAEHYLAFREFNCSGTWNDIPDDYSSSDTYVVEWSADCNNDGIVDYGQILANDLADTNTNNIPDCCESPMGCDSGPVQWEASAGGNGHWYEVVVTSALDWSEARNRSIAAGGYLVTITSEQEGAFVWSIVDQPAAWTLAMGPWIGLSQSAGGLEPAGEWQWITGETSSYREWCADCPNNDCDGMAESFAHYWGTCCWPTPSFNRARTWNDFKNDGCWDLRPVSYVVEWSSDCNSDGIVDFGQIRDGTLADANSNNIPDCCESAQGCSPCPGDVDASGSVNGVDLAAVLNTWGTSGGKYPGADTNNDGIVDGTDLAEVLNGWGSCP